MIVKFKNTFHVPGFGRQRFTKGVVHDVPDSLKDKLPKSAEILDDNYGNEKQAQKAKDDLAAADYVRAAAEGTDQKALEQAGMAGYVDASVEAPAEEPAPDLEFEGKVYKTEAAKKAAVTRSKGKVNEVSY